METQSIRKVIYALYAARVAGDKAALRSFLAPKADYEMVGAQTFQNPAAFGPTNAASASDRLVDDFRFYSVDTLTIIIDGSRAAVANKIEVSFRGGESVHTEVCDLWEFDEDGKVTSLEQFADTDQIRRLIDGGS